ncbi:MAG TPA: aspartyl protease family protein [Terriglobales bacterium]|nr:aspartyl protease family protein [Terriglobales bacterium]
MRRALLLGLVIAVGIAVGPSTALAQFYRWIDESGNAHYAEGIDNVPQRYRSSAQPLGLRNAPPSAAPAPGAATEAAGQETVIRFVPGRHIIVDARINGSASTKLILDTGASGTLISPRALAAAGVSLTRGTRVGKTRGIAKDAEVEVTQVAIDSLEVGSARVGRMLVASYDMDMQDVEGLLGQDFLGHFNVNIDPSAGVVKLTRK